jgi:hypothetical protein
MNRGVPHKNGGTCEVTGCDRPAETRRLCTAHYGRYLSGTLETDTAPIRVFAPSGAGHVDKNGYRVVHVLGHPNAWKSGHMMEHTFVMSRMLSRPLFPGETVHHRNGDRLDNRPANLELWVTRHCKGQRVRDRVEDAVTLLARYAPHLLALTEDPDDYDDPYEVPDSA